MLLQQVYIIKSKHIKIFCHTWNDFALSHFETRHLKVWFLCFREKSRYMRNISYKSINAHVIVPATYKKSIYSFLSINIMFKTCIFSCLCLDLSRSTCVLSCYCIFRWHFKDCYIFRYFFLSVENVLETSGTMNDFFIIVFWIFRNRESFKSFVATILKQRKIWRVS